MFKFRLKFIKHLLAIKQANNKPQSLTNIVQRKQSSVAKSVHLSKSLPSIASKVKRIGWSISGLVILTTTCFFGKQCLILSILPLLLFNSRDLYLISKTFRRDVIFISRFLHLYLLVSNIPRQDVTVHKAFNEISKRYYNEVMIEMDGKEWKYFEVLAYGNKAARLMQKYNHKKGDVIGLMLTNSPEFISITLGLTQIGIVCALLNTHVRLEGLAHCINISKCKTLIVSEELIPTIEDVRTLIDPEMVIFQHRRHTEEEVNKYKVFEEEMSLERSETPEMFMNLHYNDPFIYIYTSGTVGTPKAALVPHSKFRFLVNSLGASMLLGLTRNDKIYNPLPLYHTMGLIVGAGPSIVRGVPVVVRKGFSSSQYFKECKKYNCTIAQYIGEICSYLLRLPPSPADRDHNVRYALGNGLNISRWKDYVERFGLHVTELYGATESNCNMINVDGKIGAVGFLPKIIPSFLHPFYLIRVTDEGEPIRGANGLCQKCDYGEPGMLVGTIRNRIDTKFYGYVNKEQEEDVKKVIENVFRKGDRAFVTGDILEVDELLYFYFKDRTGDTFRWKGENVSTVEVENLASHLAGTVCACYGVTVEGNPGKAGMLAIKDPEGKVDLKKFACDIVEHLPRYAVPRFIRIVDDIETTGTHKIIKKHLLMDGIDLDVIKTKIYYLNLDTLIYEPLNKEILAQIKDDKIPL